MQHIQKKIQQHMQTMSTNTLFRVDVHHEDLWKLYLESFPEEIRQTYNCNACKSFIRKVGNVISINPQDLTIKTVWDFVIDDDENFRKVVKNLHDLVWESKDKIVERYIGKDMMVGIPRDDFYHFAGRFNYVREDQPEQSLKEVLTNSLEKINLPVIASIIEKINSGDLYRVNDDTLLTLFQGLKQQYESLTNDIERQRFLWVKSRTVPEVVCKIKNSSLGTLLVNLSEGMEESEALEKYETMVSSANYRRVDSSKLSQLDIERGRQQLEKEGLLGALQRRFAKLGDIDIKDLIYRDSGLPKDLDLFNLPTKGKPKSSETLTLEQFINYLQQNSVTNLEIFLERDHKNNLYSLITSDNPGQLFSWDNSFSWTYSGNLSDSIKERVKRAGGRVDSDIRMSLAWKNTDDYDLHLRTPYGTISYQRMSLPGINGKLDVDMNAGSPLVTNAVENIYLHDLPNLPHGKYSLYVHNFSKRNNENYGFEIELAIKDKDPVIVYYDRLIGHKSKVEVLEFDINSKGISPIRYNSSVAPTSSNNLVLWGNETGKFHTVDSISFSPNYWGDNKVGNKHVLINIKGMKNPDPVSPFFNEYLKQDLVQKNRRFFEAFTVNNKVTPTQEQCSGVGFSTTMKGKRFQVRVNNNKVLTVST